MAKRGGTEQSQNCPTAGSGSYGPQSENGGEGLVFETAPKHKTEKARRSDLGRLGGSRKTGGKETSVVVSPQDTEAWVRVVIGRFESKHCSCVGFARALRWWPKSKVLNSYLNTEWARGAGNKQLKGGSFILESYT